MRRESWRRGFAYSRTAQLSIRTAALWSTLLLALLCGVLFNLWHYEVERVVREEGDWHAQLVGDIHEADVARIRQYANVARAEWTPAQPDGQAATVSLWLTRRRTVFADVPRIAALAGLSRDAVRYHHALLSLYLLRDPDDPVPRLLFPLLLGIVALACASLVLIIHHAFAVFMRSRVRQLGLLASIGATPAQIRGALLGEATRLCAVPMAVGLALGLLGSAGVVALTNRFAGDIAGRHAATWHMHPLAVAGMAFCAAATVGVSAWMPAHQLAHLSPMQAIRGADEAHPKRARRSAERVGLLGVEGMLARNALRAQRRALRTASRAMTLALLAFTLMQCFFTLSAISQRMTYFARYQSVWDVMVTAQDAAIADVQAEAVRALPGVARCIAYQEAQAQARLTPDQLSAALTEAGGLPGEAQADGAHWVAAPLLILDDASFAAYCAQYGADASAGGVVLVNRIRDPRDPNFRDRAILPYLLPTVDAITLRSPETGTQTTLPVLAHADALPPLREDYGTLDVYELVHVLSATQWQALAPQWGVLPEQTMLCLVAEPGATAQTLDALGDAVIRLLSPDYACAAENRLRAEADNARMLRGMNWIFGGFCALLALIGVSNLFAYTLGFVHARGRSLARCVSMGMTPAQLRRMFALEALMLAGRPLLVTLPLAAVAVAAMLRASYLSPSVFWREAPVLPIAAFALAMAAAVALAYAVGARRALRGSLAQTLRAHMGE